MSALASFTLAILTLATVACQVGPNVASYPPASTPFGVLGKFELGETSFEAELLAVRDSSFVLLRDRQVVEAPFAVLASSSFADVSIKVSGKAPPSEEELARLRTFSRFPQGLSAELERKLLTSYGQTELVVLGK